MDPDRSPRTGDDAAFSTGTPEDAIVAAAVRDVVEDWRLPPQRLGLITWRDRVDGRRGSRRPAGLRWTRRFAAAAMTAVAATVILSLGAVWLTAPRPGPSGIGAASASPSASPSGSSRPTATPEATPLPTLFQNGALPSVTTVLVSDGATYQLADLSTGTTSRPLFPAHNSPDGAFALPGGGWVCVCADWDDTTGGTPTQIKITLETVDAAGSNRQSLPYRTIKGTADTSFSSDQRPSAVDVRVSTAPDRQHVFIGWTYRDKTTGWHSGVDVFDLATLTSVATIDLPIEDPAAVAGHPWAWWAPTIAVSPGGGTLLITQGWYTFDGPSDVSGTLHWTARWDTQAKIDGIGEGSGFQVAGSACPETDQGFATNDTLYVFCWSNAQQWIERRDLSGVILSSTDLPSTISSENGGVVAHVAGALFSWDPQTRSVGRFDLATGTLITGQAPIPAAATDPGSGDWTDALAALGRRIGNAIAPSVAAKYFLSPGFVVSADGSRAYGLGLDGDFNSGSVSSTGVFVFDAKTLASLGHWAPTADFTSLAISADDQFVYAIGAAARTSTTPQASITVFDARTGSVRLIAGRVGPDDVRFADPVLR